MEQGSEHWIAFPFLELGLTFNFKQQIALM